LYQNVFNNFEKILQTKHMKIMIGFLEMKF